MTLRVETILTMSMWNVGHHDNELIQNKFLVNEVMYGGQNTGESTSSNMALCHK